MTKSGQKCSKKKKSTDSAILFQNKGNTVFLIDTPYSIALAQTCVPPPTPTPTTTSEQQEAPHNHATPQTAPNCKNETRNHELSRSIKKHLLSVPPLRYPYPATTEPKSEKARAKVLSRIPDAERRFHDECIVPLVRDALDQIREGFESPGQEWWCLPRCVLNDGHDEIHRVRRDDAGNQQPLGPSSFSSSSTSRKRRRRESQHQDEYESIAVGSTGRKELVIGAPDELEPPLILSSTTPNSFDSLSDLRRGIVKNPSTEPAVVRVSNGSRNNNEKRTESTSEQYIVPPKSSFLLCNLPLSLPPFPSTSSSLENPTLENPIPGLSPTHKFNLILLDPPWPNRSVRRSGHYQTQAYFAIDELCQRISDILEVHSYPYCAASENSNNSSSSRTYSTQSRRRGIAAIWVTNAPKSRKIAYDSLSTAGFRVCEEWVWVKTTNDGQPVSQLDGLWRKPYEILVIGQRGEVTGNDDDSHDDYGVVSTEAMRNGKEMGREAGITRRVIAAVPDLHSRKPNLKTVFEKLFFSTGSVSLSESPQSYSALEVFARNLTAGWWACGDEVLKFNASDCWVDREIEYT